MFSIRTPRGGRLAADISAPVASLNDALQELHRSVRTQLRAPDPEDVIHDEELDNIVQNMKSLTWDQRATAVN
jgi:hypothetical protein